VKVITGEGIVDPDRDPELKPRKRNFRNFLEAYRDYTRNQESSEKIHHWVGVSIIAAALQRKVWLSRGYYTLFPNLYTLVIGPSGIVRKSTSTGIGVNLLRELMGFRIVSEKITQASLLQQLEMSSEKFTIGPREYRQSAPFIYASELSVFMEANYGSTSDLFTTFYDCIPNDSTKAWTYKTRTADAIKIYGPCLNLLGASTPEWLISKCIPREEMEGGFTSRIIFVVEGGKPVKNIPFPELDPEMEALRPKLIEDLEQIYTLKGEFVIDAEAKKFYADWYIDYRRSLATRLDPRMAGYYGRKSETILKLAMVASVAEDDSLIVRQAHIVRAMAWLQLIEASMLDAFDPGGKNEHAPIQRAVWKAIQEKGEVTHIDIIKRFWRDINGKDLTQVLTDLEAMGEIRRVIDGKGVIRFHAIGVKAAAPEDTQGSVAGDVGAG
jgi:hypothetical protein